MRRDDDAVERLRSTFGEQLHARPATAGALDDLLHGRREPDPVGERRDEGVDVAPGSTGDRAPLRARSQRQETVVVHEAGVGPDRELREGLGIGRPDRCTERHEKAMHEHVGEASAAHEIGNGLVVARRGGGKAGRARPPRLVAHETARGPIEPDDVDEEPEHVRIECIPALGEDRVEIRRPERETRRRVGDTEAHLALLRGDTELAQERDEPGVVPLVVDDEAGVDVVLHAVDLGPHGVRVAADPGVGFEHRDLVRSVQEMGRHQTGDPGTDDRDPHERTLTARYGPSRPARSAHQSHKACASSSVTRVHGSGLVCRGRRSSQKRPL